MNPLLTPKHGKRGQALVEFALVLPLLIFLILLIFDFAHLIVAYTSSSSALRRAVRNAEVIGMQSAAIPTYLDCNRIEQDALRTFFVDNHTVTIQYQMQNTSTNTWTTGACGVVTQNELNNGDLLQVTLVSTVRTLNPFISSWLPSFTFTFEGQRTIIKSIEIGSNVESDKDFDGLDDDWEVLHFGSRETYIATDDPDGDGCNNGCEESRGTDPNNPDTDGDGLDDGEEIYKYGTNPLVADSDGDGLNDGQEIAAGTNPFSGDADQDGLNDSQELAYGTDPNNPDTDGDGLNDGAEVAGVVRVIDGVSYTFTSDPTLPDSDFDGLDDNVEIAGYDVDGNGVIDYYSDPMQGDSDGDGLNDAQEVAAFTNPMNSDTDGDGLSDFDEIDGITVTVNGANVTYTTNPLKADTDNDGLTDEEEIYGIVSPVNGMTYTSDPTLPDTDGDSLIDGDEVLQIGTDPREFNVDADLDGMVDAWEELYFGSTSAANGTPTADPDTDGCNNLCEFQNGTNPLVADSDGDGISDGDEINGFDITLTNIGTVLTGVKTNPRNADTDGDGLSDGQERNGSDIPSLGLTGIITDPLNVDTDGDTLPDGVEVNGRFSGTLYVYSNPTLTDTDGDTLSDDEEVNLRQTDPGKADTDNDGIDDNVELSGSNGHVTDPRRADTDNDGMTDGEEVNGKTVNGVTYYGNPNNPDTDGDGILDGAELDGSTGYITDPQDPDTDNDGINDGAELSADNGYITDPTDADTDNDLVSDGDELSTANGYVTNPLNPDTDEDNIDDGTELANGTDPTDPLDPGTDTDNDGLQDQWEIQHFGNLTSQTATGNPDNDGCDNLCEYNNGTDPNNPDTDGDGLKDGEEINGKTVNGTTYFTNPLVFDTDGDGLSDGYELAANPTVTDPNVKNPSISVENTSIAEPACVAGNGNQINCSSAIRTLTLTVTLTNDIAGRTENILVDYRDLGLQNGQGTAQNYNGSGSDKSTRDYNVPATIKTVVFNPGVTSRTISITIYGDATAEGGSEFFYIELYNPSGAGAVIAPGKSRSMITITDT